MNSTINIGDKIELIQTSFDNGCNGCIFEDSDECFTTDHCGIGIFKLVTDIIIRDDLTEDTTATDADFLDKYDDKQLSVTSVPVTNTSWHQVHSSE